MTRAIGWASAASAVALAAAGCGYRNVGVGQPAGPRSGDGPAVTRAALTAPQLAEILQVNAFSWTYRGPRPEVWLEIEEVGQETMPRRIPDEGGVGTPGPLDEEGTILLWWRRDQEGGGGQLVIKTEGGSAGYGIGPKAFTYGWRGSQSQYQTPVVGEPVEVEPDRATTLLEYTAGAIPEPTPEGGVSASEGVPRVVLRLKARFPAVSRPL